MAGKGKKAEPKGGEHRFGFELKCLKPENVTRETTASGVVVRIECRGCAGPSDLRNPGCLNGTVSNLKETFGLKGVRFHGYMELEYQTVAMDVLEKLVSMVSEGAGLARTAKEHLCSKARPCPLSTEKDFLNLEDMLLATPENFYTTLLRLEYALRSAQTVEEGCRSPVLDATGVISSLKHRLEELVLLVWEKAFAITQIDTRQPEWLQRAPCLDDPSRLPRGIGVVFTNFRLTRPAFSMAWVNLAVPHDAVQPPLASYNSGSARVRLFKMSNRPEGLYHVLPAEYDLAQFPLEHIKVLEALKLELTERTPPDFDLTKPEQAREYAQKFAKDRLRSVARQLGTPIDNRPDTNKLEKELCEALAKYTAGLGVSEIFLEDTNLTDLYIDSPVESNNLYVVLTGPHPGRYMTNVKLTESDSKGLLSRFRYESGRPFSEASPVLECDINEFESRATVIGAPFSPKGLAFAIRKHSKEPWTLLRLINNRALTPLAAGLISFLIHGQSTIMVAGSRGAGKSSLLGAMMLEFPPHQRILTIEDTMELPVWEMQDMGYHIQPMLVQSSLGGYGEKTADDALRVALRLGESAIILGEVRGQKETGTLYEAMRAGTAGSSVMGTIHGNSPKAVRDRVVSDMKIPPTSFSATDIIIVAGVRRPAGASSSMRRVDCISEVVVDENEHIDFHDLMRYSPEVDALMPTDWFFKSQKVKSIADKFSITPEQALQHVWARGKVRHMVTEYARASSKAQVLHARNIIRYNNKYQDILDSMVERSRKEKSELDCRTIVQEWSGWFNETSQFV